jgi:hypothetical protein
MDRLAIAAEEKQLGSRSVDGLRKHSGTLTSWLVEIAFKIFEGGRG